MSRTRTVVLMGIFLIVFSALAGRILYYQVIKGESIARKAVAMRSRTVELREYQRGEVLDRNLAALTSSQTSWAVYCLPAAIYSGDNSNDKKLRQAVHFLAGVLKDSDENTILEMIIRSVEKKTAWVRIASNLTSEQIAQINQSGISGLVVVPVNKRYREDGFCAHLLGYVNSEGNDGLTGIELAYNDILQINNSSSELVSVFDARGIAIPGLIFKIRTEQNQRGSVVLTIDKRIQTIVEEAMNKSVNKGAVVVMDIQSKEILAMASRPNFNPYNLEATINYDNQSSLTNRALSKYNPGSLFKIVVSLAALQENVVDLDDKFTCKGKYVFNPQVAISCWKEEGHGDLTFSQAFTNSCNPSFINVALRLGRSRLVQYVDSLHITDETIVGYNYGGAGSYVSIDGGEPAMGNACLGQEGVMLTPVEIASLISTVADDGKWAPPSLLMYTIDKNGIKHSPKKIDKQRLIDADNAQTVQRLMEEVISNGTGKTAAIPEVKVAGKTATSQTGRMVNTDEEILNTWFAGYFPAEKPRWAVVVLVEEGTSGAQNAAPVFKAIAQGILQYHSAVNE